MNKPYRLSNKFVLEFYTVVFWLSVAGLHTFAEGISLKWYKTACTDYYWEIITEAIRIEHR